VHGLVLRLREREKEREKEKTCSFWHLVVNASVDCTNVNPIFVYFCADKNWFLEFFCEKDF
jgi:hypothetical protein